MFDPIGMFRRRSVAPVVIATFACLATAARAQKLDVQYAGTQVAGNAGWSVSSGFDCDGDGIDDVAVGAPGVGNLGIVNVYSGATHALLNTFFLNSAFAKSGFAVALVGDIDGDGFGDVVFGAPGYAGSDDGYVAAYSVKSGALLWEIYGATGEHLGFSVAAAGDVDHDGHMDVLVGATGGDNVYLFGWNTGALHVWHGTQGNYTFGYSVAGNVDVDGDGTPDLIVGEPNYSFAFHGLSMLLCGRVAVFSGATYNPLWSALGDNQWDMLGRAVCGLGDVDGDGRAEVLAGAPLYGNYAGLVRKFSGTGVKLSDVVGVAPSDQFGSSICAVPDIDHDGIREYASGAIGNGISGYVELRKGDDDTLLWTFQSTVSSETHYGFSVAGGDVNGDGRGDVVIGDPDYDVGSLTAAGNTDVWVTVAATSTNYGAGFPGTLGIPALTALNAPAIGTKFSAGITNSFGSATTGIVFLGLSRSNFRTTAGGTLLVAPFDIFAVPIPASGAILSGPISNDPALLGVLVDLQVLETDPGAAHKISFTPGLELEIGVDYP